MTSSTIDDEFVEFVEFLKDEMDRDDNPAMDGPPTDDDHRVVEVEVCGAESEYGHTCGENAGHVGRHICCDVPDNPRDDFDNCDYMWSDGEE